MYSFRNADFSLILEGRYCHLRSKKRTLKAQSVPNRLGLIQPEEGAIEELGAAGYLLGAAVFFR
jgi:hypothetical protein